MVRKAEFDDAIFISSTIRLIAAGGPNAATMAAIAQNANAPTGSIYHRFKSRTALMGAAWHHALQDMAETILPALHRGDSEQAVSALCDWSAQKPELARVILLYDENDLMDGAVPDDLMKAIGTINRKLGAGLTALLTSRKKTLSAANLALANFAIFDGPIAAMKPMLRNRLSSPSPKPQRYRETALACCRASIKLLE